MLADSNFLFQGGGR